jgi:hypothetical protein
LFSVQYKAEAPSKKSVDKATKRAVTKSRLAVERAMKKIPIDGKSSKNRAKIAAENIAKALAESIKQVTEEEMKKAYMAGKGAVAKSARRPGLRFGGKDELALQAIRTDKVLYDAYAGLSERVNSLINERIEKAYEDPRGFDWRSLSEQIMDVADVAQSRAETIARTESHVAHGYGMLNALSEIDPDGVGRYKWMGPEDDRMTKMSKWLMEKTKNGVTLEEFEQLADESVRLARMGQFAPGGPLFNVQGKAIVLPSDFKRRGLALHFNERDTLVRVR